MEEPSGLSSPRHLRVRIDHLRFGLALILDPQRSLLFWKVWIAEARFQPLPCRSSNRRYPNLFSEAVQSLARVLAYCSFASYCLVHVLSLTHGDRLFLSRLIQRGSDGVASASRP